MAQKEFTVSTFDYDMELGTTVYVDHEEFDTEEEAMNYARSVEQTISSRTVVRGDYGYKEIARLSRRTR